VACLKKVLNKEKSTEEIKYENLLNGTVEEKLKIARKFGEIFLILEKIKKEKHEKIFIED
jgi:hypothetical protein